MPHQTIVFHELTKYIPWGIHDRLVGEHGGDDRRALSAKSHLIDMSMEIRRRPEPARDRSGASQPWRQALSSRGAAGFALDAGGGQCVASGSDLQRGAFGADEAIAEGDTGAKSAIASA